MNSCGRAVGNMRCRSATRRATEVAQQHGLLESVCSSCHVHRIHCRSPTRHAAILEGSQARRSLRCALDSPVSPSREHLAARVTGYFRPLDGYLQGGIAERRGGGVAVRVL